MEKNIKEILGSGRTRDILRSNCMKLKEFLKIEKTIAKKIKRSDLLLFTGKGHPTYCPAIIEFNEDFCKILGYYLSNGTTQYEKRNHGIRAKIQMILPEKPLKELEKILTKCNIRYLVVDHKNSKKRLSISSKILAFVFHKILGCGEKKEEVNVPDEIFSLDENRRKSFIGGIFKGNAILDFTSPKKRELSILFYKPVAHPKVDLIASFSRYHTRL